MPQRPPVSLARADQLSGVLIDLFDQLPDTVFFIKDRDGCYRAANLTLVSRCGLRRKADLLGRTVHDVFPAKLADTYAAQDRRVIESGESISGKLELHLYPNRRPGWCVTSKQPLRDSHGRITGLAGLSRDVQASSSTRAVPAAVAAAIDRVCTRYHERLTVAHLAKTAGMSANTFGRVIKRLFHLTPSQLLQQARLQVAAQRLRDTRQSMAEIANACGFYDQSAFSRHFKAATGLSPFAYRRTSSPI